MTKALTAVLHSNFRKFGKASERIDRGDFVIQDDGTGRDIDLTQDWELCFLPGQHVSMSMIFDQHNVSDFKHGSCPNCKWHHHGLVKAEIEWYLPSPERRF
jgi:hypothetical protein